MIVAESPTALDMRAKAPALYNLEAKGAVPQTQWIQSAATFYAHCTTGTHMDFELTPTKRAKEQAALVVICGLIDESNSSTSAEQPVHNFLVESILPLHDDDAKVAKASLLKLISLIALAGQRGGEKRENSGWSEDASPAKIAKCRSLTRYPTGDEIPAYSHSA